MLCPPFDETKLRAVTPLEHGSDRNAALIRRLDHLQTTQDSHNQNLPLSLVSLNAKCLHCNRFPSLFLISSKLREFQSGVFCQTVY